MNKKIKEIIPEVEGFISTKQKKKSSFKLVLVDCFLVVILMLAFYAFLEDQCFTKKSQNINFYKTENNEF